MYKNCPDKFVVVLKHLGNGMLEDGVRFFIRVNNFYFCGSVFRRSDNRSQGRLRHEGGQGFILTVLDRRLRQVGEAALRAFGPKRRIRALQAKLRDLT